MLPTQEALFQRRQLFKRKVSPEQSSCLSVIHLPLALDRSFIHKYISEDIQQRRLQSKVSHKRNNSLRRV